MPPACIIREDGEEYCVYPLDDLMSVLGRRWSLFIISVLGNRVTTRFNELLRQLEGISPRTLADRLRELDSLRLVSRTAYAEVPLRVEYSLTDDGRRMRKALIPFLKWSIDLERNRTIA
jgi:DNA-binding HxlR family transcriptional regulator